MLRQDILKRLEEHLIKNLTDSSAVGLTSVLHKIDYRAGFGPYLCKEDQQFADLKTSEKTDITPSISSQSANFSAENRISHYYYSLLDNKNDAGQQKVATEYLIYSDADWLLGVRGDEDNQWESVDSKERQLKLQWNIPPLQGDLPTQNSYSECAFMIKILLRHPETEETLGTENLKVCIDSSKVNVLTEKTKEIILDFLRSDIVKHTFELLNIAYASLRDYRRIVLQKDNLTKVGRYLFTTESQEAQIAHQGVTNSVKKEERLPRLMHAVDRALKFLGEYIQARHLVLIEVYSEKTNIQGEESQHYRPVDIRCCRTWSCNIDDCFEDPSFINEIKTPHLYHEKFCLQKETEQLIQLAYSIDFNKALPVSGWAWELGKNDQDFFDDLTQQVNALVAKPLFNIAQQLKSQFAAKHSDAAEILLNDLTVRTIKPFFDSSRVFKEDHIKAEWLVAVIDRKDTTVDRGNLHIWNDFSPIKERDCFNKQEIDDELNLIVSTLSNEFTYYLHSFKNDCKQKVWRKSEVENTHDLSSGAGFDAESNSWLQWIEQFVHDRLRCDHVEFLVAKQSHELIHKYLSVTTKSFDQFIEERNAKDAHKKFEHFDHTLRLLIGKNNSQLLIPLRESAKHFKRQKHRTSSYTTRYILNLKRDNQCHHKFSRFCYVHLLFLQSIAKQIARLRKESSNQILQQQLTECFQHENALMTSLKKLAVDFSPSSNNLNREHLLAEQILEVLQQNIIQPFFGYSFPMFLATQNSSEHMIHLGTNLHLNRQFQLEEENLFQDGKSTLRFVLNKLGNKQSEQFAPKDNVLSRPDKPIKTGRYAFAVRLNLLEGHLFDGILLFLGRNGQKFDYWETEVLKTIGRAIVPLLSISCIAHQSFTQMGIFKHAINSPIQGVISNAMLALALAKNENTAANLSANYAQTIEKAEWSIERNKQQIRSWQASLEALQGEVKVQLNKKHNILEDLSFWTQRYEEFARTNKIKVLNKIPRGNFEITYDPIRLDIAFSNILDNAIKYAHPNTEVDVCFESDGSYILIQITNIGPYISESARTRLINLGQRASNSNIEGLIDGQGIGLPIVVAFVQAHPKGQLLIDSRLINKSTEAARTTFTIKFCDYFSTKLGER